MNNAKRDHSKQGRGEYNQLKLMQNLKYGLKFARELYYSCLLVFLFYERVIFNQFFKTGLDYSILGMTCFGFFLFVSFTKHRIPLKLLFALTVIQLIIIGVLFYDIGFRLPEEYTESFLTAWAFGKGGQTSLAVLLLVSLPLSYREFANRCFLMEKLLLDKEIPLELSSPGSDYFIT